ncbi:DUF6500 family protein [Pseudoalteromonas sp. G4]|uniref:DUF6500 family protein n=1 Tax=Pseudoalteromonas sp. G4 TaxID=2992761 RepID=UPI00406D1191
MFAQIIGLSCNESGTQRKNNDPERLMEVARWWIETHQLDHFEKAKKIKEMVLAGR